MDIQEIKRLSVAEQVFIVEEIWDNIANQAAHVEVPEWHRRELEKRWENYLRHPEQTVSWGDIVTDIRRVNIT